MTWCPYQRMRSLTSVLLPWPLIKLPRLCRRWWNLWKHLYWYELRLGQTRPTEVSQGTKLPFLHRNLRSTKTHLWFNLVYASQKLQLNSFSGHTTWNVVITAHWLNFCLLIIWFVYSHLGWKGGTRLPNVPIWRKILQGYAVSKLVILDNCPVWYCWWLLFLRTFLT